MQNDRWQDSQTYCVICVNAMLLPVFYRMNRWWVHMMIWAPTQTPLLLLDKKTSQDDFQQTGPVSSNKAWQQLSDTLMHALSTLS